MGDMNDTHLFARVQELSDVELAMLLSLVAGQHCIIETEEEVLESLAEESQLVSYLVSLPLCLPTSLRIYRSPPAHFALHQQWFAAQLQ